MAGIYIHIPFCRKACHYCDFHFSTTLNLLDDIVDAIILEAESMKNYIQEPIETIYFGGGTPSLLEKKHLDKIVSALYKHYSISNSIEFTLEANPDDLTEEKIQHFSSIGVNRLSIGTQSFHDSDLSFLNRSHTAKQTKQAVELCNKHNINNLSLDLMYGIPNQTEKQWKQNLEEMVHINPNHISCYSLTIEEKTVFGNWKRNGKLVPVADEHIIDEYEYMVEYLTSYGYQHYEVSNFSKPHKHSKHNSSYWHQKSYLGLGPGAHSFNGNSRHFNISSNPKYLKSIGNDTSHFTQETLTTNELVTEYIFTRIRTKWGVDFNVITKLFNYHLSTAQLNYITTIVSEKMATFVNNKLILNSKGFFISDTIVLELIP